jgi:BRCT domain type II-containing protein
LELIANEIRGNVKIKIVVVTGTLIISATKFSALVSSAGYEVKESPATAGTAFVVQGYNGGQSKIDKAKKYGRPVLTEQDAVRVLHLLRERKEG